MSTRCPVCMTGDPNGKPSVCKTCNDELLNNARLGVYENPNTESKMQALWSEMSDIRKAKNADYGEAWKDAGAKGLFIRIWDKAKRLKKLLWHSAESLVKSESIRDTLLDLANYCLFAVICLDENNMVGEE